MAEDTPEVMTIAETAQYLRVPLAEMESLEQAERIPCHKNGGPEGGAP